MRSVCTDRRSTSPSVYVRPDTLWATNACGDLGPTATNAIFAYDLIDVATWMPTQGTESIHASHQLYLSDLGTYCPSTEPMEEEASAYLKNEVNRCNPRLAWPMDFERYGYPYWKHCGMYNNRFGVYDPPT